MSANPPPLYTSFTVINSLVLTSTLLRLSFRLHIRRFWWEDAWAAAAFVSGTAFVVTQYVAVDMATNRHVTGFVMASCWITSVFSTITMCAVRMSILYSIIRIMSPSSRIRTFARIVAIFFLIFCATSVALRSTLCTNPIIAPKGTQPVTRKCINGNIFMIFQVATDCISDAILVILPLKLLWRIKLLRQRRMILASFSSSAIVSIFSLVHGIFPNFNDVKFDLTLNMETTSALIVCNLLVLVTYMYRVICKLRGESVSSESDDMSEDDDFTTRTSARMNTEALTTVDLDVGAGYSGVISGLSSSSRSCSAVAEKQGD